MGRTTPSWSNAASSARNQLPHATGGGRCLSTAGEVVPVTNPGLLRQADRFNAETAGCMPKPYQASRRWSSRLVWASRSRNVTATPARSRLTGHLAQTCCNSVTWSGGSANSSAGSWQSRCWGGTAPRRRQVAGRWRRRVGCGGTLRATIWVQHDQQSARLLFPHNLSPGGGGCARFGGWASLHDRAHCYM